MELTLRCTVPDRPGALAALAGTIAEAGGDILSVDVVEHEDGLALDDVVVLLPGRDVRTLLARIAAVDGVEVVHAGPSRGHPGDAATRLAIGLEAIMNGAMTLDDAVLTIVGGLLRVDGATLTPPTDAPEEGKCVLVLDFDGRALVLRREYRFTRTERERALAITRLCQELGRHVGASSSRSG